MRLLRASIVLVTFVAFLFSLLFPLKEFIQMFIQITITIFVGGAGAVLIGGLYWKRGTTRAAWCAMILGCGLSSTTIFLRTVWKDIPFCVSHWGNELPINSMVMSFLCAMAACIVYVVVSFLDTQKTADMDKLLHRGKYTIKEEEEELKKRGATDKSIHFLWKLIGVNSHEFSKTDKAIFLSLFLINVGFFCLYFILLICGWLGRMSPKTWLFWYRIEICLDIFLATVFLVWVSIGGLFDLKRMYKSSKH
jgi:solute:Na+ symporter, SSS family